ncbi:MAG: biosynthetic-type acetolactate synthase large subunit [Proteobacteria bacterium]|nr:biosynthetic-type acetolactate synthase large subunit [Pseudomonadota bacterium]
MILDSAPETTGEAPIEGAEADLRELTGSEIVWEALLREGVDVCFGYPGGAIMPTYDALVNYPIRHVLTRHEQGASHMADGYARASGKVGVAIATSGPGATNLVTGLATAMLDSIPMVCITGQVPSHLLGSDAFQETDITGVTLPVTKHNYLVTRTEDLAATLREAFHVARSGRPGPVLVDITKDAQLGRCLYDPEAEPAPLPARRIQTPSENAFIEAARLIEQAERPLILAGQGVIFAGATDELTTLVERAHIPVANTLLGLGGFPASHALNLGMMGMHGDASVNSAVQKADLLIAIGMRFDDRVTGNLEAFAKHAKKIHIELDPAEINKNVQVDIPLLGDAKAMLERLLTHVKPADHAPWMREITDFKADTAARDIAGLPDNGKLYAAHVLHDLWTLTKGEALIVSDVGQHQMWEAQYYKHDQPRSLLTSGGLGTMGFALPAAIGARFTRKHDNIWVVVGDGGFQMTACELSTCAQEGIKINIAIINNGYLGMVRQWQEFFYGGRYVATPMKSPDFIKLADAHDLPGRRVTRREDIAAAVAEAEAHPETFVIDFRVVEEDAVYPMVPAGADVDDMIRRPLPGAQ